MLETLIFSALAILIGLAFAFAGWTYFRILFPIWGFIVGMMGGAQFMMGLSNSPGFIVGAMGLIVGLVVGVIFALLANFVYRLAVILFGASTGYALGAGFWTLLGIHAPFLAMITGFIVAFAMVMFFMAANMPKWIMIVLTGASGAMVMVAGILALFGQIPPNQLGLAFVSTYVGNSIFWLIAWAVVAGLGMLTQYQMAKQEELSKQLYWVEFEKEMMAQ